MAGPAERSEQTKALLVQSALNVVAAEGVKGVTYRKVASTAGVSVGILSYHFANLEQLLIEAFTVFMNRSRERYEFALNEATSIDEIADSLIGMIGRHNADSQDSTLLYELYAQGVRDSHYRDLIQDWSRSTHRAMTRMLPQDAVIGLESLVEGMLYQRAFGLHPVSDDLIRDLVLKIIDSADVRAASPAHEA